MLNNKTNKLLEKIIVQNTKIIELLDVIRQNTYNTSKNTYQWEYKPKDTY